MALSNTIISGENKDLEGKISELEAQKVTTDTQAGELRARVIELGAQNSSLETLLKATNERKMNITPLHEHTLLLRRKIYQVQLKLTEEVYKVKQAEIILQDILVVLTNIKTRTQEIMEVLQGQITCLETNT